MTLSIAHLQPIVALIAPTMPALSSRPFWPENARHRPYVSDNGSGVDSKVADRLFTPFVTTKSSGMGIGLSLYKTIIQRHDGAVNCAANTPKGATFWFTLPIVERTEAAK